jgi:hypothetical protein
MASRDSIVRDLLDKLRDAPNEELSEVADFAEFLHAKRLKRAVVTPSSPSLDELEARAAAAGLLRPPEPNARRLSTTEVPPVQVGGKPASEIVLEDRR